MCISYIPGGHLGLWVGISVITLCEILGLVTYTLKQLCHWGYTYIESNKVPERTQEPEMEDFQCEDPEPEPHEHNDTISSNHVNSNSRDKKVITHFSF